MKKVYLILALATASATFTSCSKEETTNPVATDVRDQALGSYNFTIQSNLLNSDGSITAVGDPSSPAVLKLEKGNSNTILFNDNNGVTQISGSKIATANNGFTFDISEQTFDSLTITGWNGVTLGSVKYHGYYNSSTKNVVFYGKFTKDGIDGVLRFSGNK